MIGPERKGYLFYVLNAGETKGPPSLYFCRAL